MSTTQSAQHNLVAVRDQETKSMMHVLQHTKLVVTHRELWKEEEQSSENV